MLVNYIKYPNMAVILRRVNLFTTQRCLGKVSDVEAVKLRIHLANDLYERRWSPPNSGKRYVLGDQCGALELIPGHHL